MILISLHAFIYISNSHSHSHFYIRSYLLLLLLLLSPHNPFTFKSFFTFLPFYPFTFKTASRRSRCYVATQSFVRRDVAIATSGRSFGRIGRGVKGIVIQPEISGSALSNSSHFFLQDSGLLNFCPCVRQQYKM